MRQAGQKGEQALPVRLAHFAPVCSDESGPAAIRERFGRREPEEPGARGEFG